MKFSTIAKAALIFGVGFAAGANKDRICEGTGKLVDTAREKFKKSNNPEKKEVVEEKKVED